MDRLETYAGSDRRFTRGPVEQTRYEYDRRRGKEPFAECANPGVYEILEQPARSRGDDLDH